MFSLSIVIRFYVFELAGSRALPAEMSLAVDQFNFQCVKKAVHRGIVIAVEFKDRRLVELSGKSGDVELRE